MSQTNEIMTRAVNISKRKLKGKTHLLLLNQWKPKAPLKPICLVAYPIIVLLVEDAFG